MRYERVLLIGEKDDLYAKVKIEFIDWNKSGIARSKLYDTLWEFRFVMMNGKVFRSKRIYCTTEEEARCLFEKHKMFMQKDNNVGSLYVFLVARDNKETGEKQVEVYEDGATRGKIISEDKFRSMMMKWE